MSYSPPSKVGLGVARYESENKDNLNNQQTIYVHIASVQQFFVFLQSNPGVSDVIFKY